MKIERDTTTYDIYPLPVAKERSDNENEVPELSLLGAEMNGHWGRWLPAILGTDIHAVIALLAQQGPEDNISKVLTRLEERVGSANATTIHDGCVRAVEEMQHILGGNETPYYLGTEVPFRITPKMVAAVAALNSPTLIQFIEKNIRINGERTPVSRDELIHAVFTGGATFTLEFNGRSYSLAELTQIAKTQGYNAIRLPRGAKETENLTEEAIPPSTTEIEKVQRFVEELGEKEDSKLFDTLCVGLSSLIPFTKKVETEHHETMWNTGTRLDVLSVRLNDSVETLPKRLQTGLKTFIRRQRQENPRRINPLRFWGNFEIDRKERPSGAFMNAILGGHIHLEAVDIKTSTVFPTEIVDISHVEELDNDTHIYQADATGEMRQIVHKTAQEITDEMKKGLDADAGHIIVTLIQALKLQSTIALLEGVNREEATALKAIIDMADQSERLNLDNIPNSPPLGEYLGMVINIKKSAAPLKELGNIIKKIQRDVSQIEATEDDKTRLINYCTQFVVMAALRNTLKVRFMVVSMPMLVPHKILDKDGNGTPLYTLMPPDEMDSNPPQLESFITSPVPLGRAVESRLKRLRTLGASAQETQA